jgi:hypothetical protein
MNEKSRTTTKKTTVSIETIEGPVIVTITPKYGRGRKYRVTVKSQGNIRIAEEPSVVQGSICSLQVYHVTCAACGRLGKDRDGIFLCDECCGIDNAVR